MISRCFGCIEILEIKLLIPCFTSLQHYLDHFLTMFAPLFCSSHHLVHIFRASVEECYDDIIKLRCCRFSQLFLNSCKTRITEWIRQVGIGFYFWHTEQELLPDIKRIIHGSSILLVCDWMLMRLRSMKQTIAGLRTIYSPPAPNIILFVINDTCQRYKQRLNWTSAFVVFLFLLSLSSQSQLLARDRLQKQDIYNARWRGNPFLSSFPSFQQLSVLPCILHASRKFMLRRPPPHEGKPSFFLVRKERRSNRRTDNPLWSGILLYMELFPFVNCSTQ